MQGVRCQRCRLLVALDCQCPPKVVSAPLHFPVESGEVAKPAETITSTVEVDGRVYNVCLGSDMIGRLETR